MYICHDCNNNFKEPKKMIEKHRLTLPPYEIICVCPHCKSQNYEFKKRGFCRCCGSRLQENQTDYCSAACKTRGQKLLEKQQNYKQKLFSSPIYKAVRQVDEYNQKHHSRLSYGQFFATVCKTQKGGRKNG